MQTFNMFIIIFTAEKISRSQQSILLLLFFCDGLMVKFARANIIQHTQTKIKEQN